MEQQLPQLEYDPNKPSHAIQIKLTHCEYISNLNVLSTSSRACNSTRKTRLSIYSDDAKKKKKEVRKTDRRPTKYHCKWNGFESLLNT